MLHTDPDREQGDAQEGEGGDGADDVGPHAAAVHYAVEHAQAELEQRAAPQIHDDLKVLPRQDMRTFQSQLCCCSFTGPNQGAGFQYPESPASCGYASA